MKDGVSFIIPPLFFRLTPSLTVGLPPCPQARLLLLDAAPLIR